MAVVISKAAERCANGFLQSVIPILDPQTKEQVSPYETLRDTSFVTEGLSGQERIEVVIACIRGLERAALQLDGAKAAPDTSRILDSKHVKGSVIHHCNWKLHDIMPTQFKRDPELITLLMQTLLETGFCASCAGVGDWTLERTLSFVKSSEDAVLSDPAAREILVEIKRSARGSSVVRTIDLLLATDDNLPIDEGEAWSDAAISVFEAAAPDARGAWAKLFLHCTTASASKPSPKWMKKAQEITKPLEGQLVETLTDWFALVDRPRTKPIARISWHDGDITNHMILEEHATILKGLCWVASTQRSDNLTRALGGLAISSYKKLPAIGPRLVKLGNAAVFALGQIEGEASLGQLAMLRVKIKFGTAQKMLEKALDAAAEREGLPRDEIEEMAVPSYGLARVGEADEPMGEHTALLRIADTSGAPVTITWKNSKGKITKSVPKAVKEQFADDLKDLKASAKDIQKMSPAQRDRIDAMFLDRKSWAVPTWRERYLDHPLVGTIARRLIWLFDNGRETTSAAWVPEDSEAASHGPGHLALADGTPFQPDPDLHTVKLWHPIDEDAEPGTQHTREDVLAWREFYESRQIRQPFKQAHREVYLLTDAERQTETYSNRFAAHVLRQHQVNALGAQRGWKSRLRLMVDDEYPPPSRTLRHWDLRAEFWVEGLGDDFTEELVLDSGAFRYLTTDQVRFYRIDAAQSTAHATGGQYTTWGPEDNEANHPLRLDRIPPIVLSEILRDVDLFVGVASVGNNPEWSDGGPGGHFREYWHTYSFGDLSATAQTRRELLVRLIPRLKIADTCTIRDNFLVVLGKKRTYKIHLGSGNILMEPNDQYLCIVPNASMQTGPKGKLFLPFEGDRTLAIILSKAFLLAEDDKITDPTILRQIGSR